MSATRRLRVRSMERRRAFRSARPHLRSGIYLPGGPHLWYRTDAKPLPDHVLRTKGQRTADEERGVKLRRVIRTLRRGARAVWVRGGGNGDVLVAAHDGGVVVLDRGMGRVVRTYGTGAVTEDYVRWRRLFTECVSAPDFSVGADGRILVEEYVHGSHLLDVSVAERISALKALLGDYLRLAAGAVESSRDDFVSTLRSAMTKIDVPADLLAMWNGAHITWLEAAPILWVPSACEALAKNLIITPEGRATPIDLGDLKPDPVFVYPIGIILDAGGDVISAYLSGELDDELQSLFAVSGHVWPRSREARQGLVLVRTAYAAYRDAVAGRNTPCPKEFASSLRRRWIELRPVIA